MRHRTKSLLIPAALVAIICETSAAEIIGIGAAVTDVYAPPDGIAAACLLYVLTDAPNDNIIGISNATIFLSGVVPPPGFYNASPNPGVDPIAGAAPLTGIDWFTQPQMIADSYVTIGQDQIDRTNATVLEPSFDDLSFLASGSTGTRTGWYNSDPSNEQGLPDPYSLGAGYVLIGVFSIYYPDEAFPQPPPTLNVTSMTVTYLTGPFGSDLHTWELTTPLSIGYLPPAPGAIAPLIMLGLIARRRRV